MDRLPDTSELPNEIVVSCEQRNGYDHALRAAGILVLNPLGLQESLVEPVLLRLRAVLSDRQAG